MRLRYFLINLHYNYLKYMLGFGFYCLSRILYPVAKQKAVNFLLMSIRESYFTPAILFLKRVIEQHPEVILSLASPPVAESEACSRSIVLSHPIVEGDHIVKGVILIKFTRTFTYFLQEPVFSNLNKHYMVILEPSWAGYADADILSFLIKADQCIVEATEVQDRILLSSLFPHHRAVQFGSGNWVDPETFSPPSSLTTTSERSYDFIYIANMSPLKRVLRALIAVREISKVIPDYHALIVCAGWGKEHESNYQRFIEDNAITNNVTISRGMNQQELASRVAQSKVSILLSLKEGSNRSIFESMMAGTPALLVAENTGSNKSYINECTGLIVKDKLLESTLIYFYHHWDTFKPRQWAMENVTPEATTRILKTMLEGYGHGRINTDLALKTNTPELRYVDQTKHNNIAPLLRMTREEDFDVVHLDALVNG